MGIKTSRSAASYEEGISMGGRALEMPCARVRDRSSAHPRLIIEVMEGLLTGGDEKEIDRLKERPC
jgi:hypothetical protein